MNKSELLARVRGDIEQAQNTPSGAQDLLDAADDLENACDEIEQG